MDELPRDEWPYGVDTIRLRITWPAPRRWVSGYRWDIAQGAIPPWAAAARPLARSPDAGLVRVADEEEKEREQEREETLPHIAPSAPSSRSGLLSPDSGPLPPLSPLAPGLPPYSPLVPGAAPGSKATAPRAVPPPLPDSIPGTPEQKLRLRREMEKTGQIERNDGNEAHHMVPQSSRNMTGRRDPSRAQDVLKQFGFDLDSVENGAALSANSHRRIHTNEYYDYVTRNMINLLTREQVSVWLSRFREQLREADQEFQRSGQLPSWATGAAP